jgi:uncharacterized protein YraI
MIWRMDMDSRARSLRLICLLMTLLLLASACSLRQETRQATPTLAVPATSTTVPLPTQGILPTRVFTATPQSVEQLATAVIVPTRTPESIIPTAVLPPTVQPAGIPPTEVANAAVPALDAQVSQGRTGLRLRTAPDTNSRILRNLTEFTKLTILGRSSDGLWINVLTEQGDAGWVMSQFVDLYIDLNSVAIVDTGSVQVASVNTNTSSSATIIDGQVVGQGGGVNLRAIPSTNGTVLTTLPEFTTLDILGKTADNAWLQVKSPSGITGWVWAAYIQVNIDLGAIPIPAEAYEPTPSVFTQPVNIATGSISGVTSNAAQIFLTGQSYGNRAGVFSKVGDSITATGHFMYSFGWGRYNLHEYSYLQPVIGFFSATTARESNSFSNGSLAAKSGWKTGTVLDPAYADPAYCQPGETPLVCEYRVVRPSISLIMLGTNDMETPTSVFESNMQTIIQTTINMGIIPVLSTIPPRDYWDGKVATYNQIIINLARGYDIPLIDLHSALLGLPNRGLDEDGVHPSWVGDAYENYDPSGDFSAENLQNGFPMRNLITLQMLDALWRQVIAANEYTGPIVGDNTSGLNGFAGSSPNTSNSFTQSFSTTCPGAVPVRLQVGGLGRVTPGLANNLRSSPEGQKIGEIPAGAVFTVLEGPVCSGGMNYWKINYNGTIAWTAEGKGVDYWLEPL